MWLIAATAAHGKLHGGGLNAAHTERWCGALLPDSPDCLRQP